MTNEMTEVEVNLSNTVDLLESRLADMQLALDDIGWNPLGMELDQNELPLTTITEVSDTTRALVAINPLVKRGVSVRTSYIWGNGINFEGVDENNRVFQHPLNKKFLFTAEAHAEMEKCLATDGNFFFLAKGSLKGNTRGRRSATPRAGDATGMRVPMKQIRGIVTNPENPEDVWFYRREWDEVKWNAKTEQTAAKRHIEYVPSDLYMESAQPKTIGGVKVNWDAVLIEHSVNKQVGWRFGLPDAMAVIFWAKAHKEFLEDSAKLVKAYSRFAFKATAATPGSVRAVAAKVAQQPTRDPQTGTPNDIGATAVMSAGSNLQSIGRTAGSVDFSAGTALAGYVAAGLEIPLTDLLADSSLSNRSASETLSDSKLAAMVQRQNSWAAFFERLFSYWGQDVEVHFDHIEKDTAIKQVQAVMLAMASNVLSAQEIRDLLVVAFDLKTDAGLPTEEELGLLILAQKKAEEAQAKADAQAEKVANSAKQQTDPSYGDNSNRDDAGGAHEYDPTDGNGSK